MALTVTARGTASTSTSGSGLAISPSSTIPAGGMGVLVVSISNNGASGASSQPAASLTDSVGNVWTRRVDGLFDPSSAGNGAEVVIYTCLLTTSLTTSDNVTTSSVSNTVWCLALWQVSTDAADKTVGFITSGTGTGATSTSPSVTTGSITSGDCVIGGISIRGNGTVTADSDTSNGSWSSAQTTQVPTPRQVTTQAKIVTGTATQTYNVTITSVAWMIGWVQIRELPLLSAAQGSFTLTGETSNLLFGRKITAGQGAYAVTGENAALLVGRKITAGQGAYVFTGETANLLAGRKLVAGEGSYIVTGEAAGLLFKHLLTAVQGSYALTGESAGLYRGYPMSAAQGNFNLITGQVSDLIAFWLFNEEDSDTSLVDSTGRGHDFTGLDLTGRMDRGKINNGLRFAGTDIDTISQSSDDFSSARGARISPFVFWCWFKRGTPDSNQTLARVVGSSSLLWRLFWQDNDLLYFTNGIDSVTSDPVLSDDTWHLAVAWWDGDWNLQIDHGDVHRASFAPPAFETDIELVLGGGTHDSLLQGMLDAVGYRVSAPDSVFLDLLWNGGDGTETFDDLSDLIDRVNLFWGRLAAPAQGSYALTGEAINFPRTYVIGASEGSYTLTGQDAALLFGRKIAATQGAYVLTGETVNLLFGRRMVADEGSYIVTGEDAELLFGRQISAAEGAYSVSGQAANLLFSRRVTPANGVYVFTGEDANLVVSGSGAILFSVGHGSFVLTGEDAGFHVAHKVSAANGVYVVTGQTANLLSARVLGATQGVYALSGQTVAFQLAHKIAAALGSYSFTGETAALLRGRLLAAVRGTFTETGFDLRDPRTIGSGSFALTGEAANLLWQHLIAAEQGEYDLTGINARLYKLIPYFLDLFTGGPEAKSGLILPAARSQIGSVRSGSVLSGQRTDSDLQGDRSADTLTVIR